MRLYCNAYRLRAGAKLGALEEFVREDVRGGSGGRRNRFERKLVNFKREGRLRKRFACKSGNFVREGRRGIVPLRLAGLYARSKPRRSIAMPKRHAAS